MTVKTIALLAAALVVCIVALGLLGTVRALSFMHSAKEPTALRHPLPPPPHVSTQRPVVAVLASHAGSEVTDLVSPYSVFAETGRMEVLVVAPRREVAPLWPALELVPHMSFEEFDQAVPSGPDVVVVPNVQDPDNAELQAWINDHVGTDTIVVSICEGARLVAAAGLLAGRQATTHFTALRDLAEQYPGTTWLRDVRYVWDGNVVSSAGVTAALDVSFAAVARLLGPAVAHQTAQRLGYRLQPRTQQSPSLGTADLAAIFPHIALRPDRLDVAYVVQDGADELEVAAFVDTFKRAMRGETTTVAAERRIHRSRRGLWLVPQYASADAPAHYHRYASTTFRPPAPAVAHAHALAEVARLTDPAVADFVAKTIEHPLVSQ